jgi:hypothetical protein
MYLKYRCLIMLCKVNIEEYHFKGISYFLIPNHYYEFRAEKVKPGTYPP